MDGPKIKSLLHNYKPKDKSKDTENSKMTSKERREKYFIQLRSWLHTVNSYECYYNKLRQEIHRKKYVKVSKNPTTTEEPREVPNVVPETTTVEPTQFVGML